MLKYIYSFGYQNSNMEAVYLYCVVYALLGEVGGKEAGRSGLTL